MMLCSLFYLGHRYIVAQKDLNKTGKSHAQPFFAYANGEDGKKKKKKKARRLRARSRG
jgi:hypothetical protein